MVVVVDGGSGGAGGRGRGGGAAVPWVAPCREDHHRGHDGAAATPGSAGQVASGRWSCRQALGGGSVAVAGRQHGGPLDKWGATGQAGGHWTGGGHWTIVGPLDR